MLILPTSPVLFLFKCREQEIGVITSVTLVGGSALRCAQWSSATFCLLVLVQNSIGERTAFGKFCRSCLAILKWSLAD